MAAPPFARFARKLINAGVTSPRSTKPENTEPKAILLRSVRRPRVRLEKSWGYGLFGASSGRFNSMVPPQRISATSLFPRGHSAMNASECTRRHDSHQQCACAQDKKINWIAQIEITYLAYKDISDSDVKRSPHHVDRRGGQTLSRRLGKRTLKRTAHHSTHEMRNSVG